MVAACLATSTAGCIGSTTTVDMMRTRSVSTAAAAIVTKSSWFGYATRSPRASVENGPASMRRHHSRVSERVTPATIVGRVRPISMRVGLAQPRLVEERHDRDLLRTAVGQRLVDQPVQAVRV